MQDTKRTKPLSSGTPACVSPSCSKISLFQDSSIWRCVGYQKHVALVLRLTSFTPHLFYAFLL
jgi:hypothetical protein